MKHQGADGFGMIEVVVSMFMLALLAIAFLPVLIQGLKTSVANSTLATATALVNQSIEQARAQSFMTCSELESFAMASVADVDAHGNTITVTRSAIGCDASDSVPELLSVSATSSGDPAKVLASAATHILLVTP